MRGEYHAADSLVGVAVLAGAAGVVVADVDAVVSVGFTSLFTSLFDSVFSSGLPSFFASAVFPTDAGADDFRESVT
ncbi:MAG: hypothetical protein M3M96_02845 [Candidatus Eremiobacteraeota bacterium]|nr:hypothetical protein [Candidatus Eremiobacteraeota bacterium]